MSTNFMSAVKGTLNDEFNVSVTENGAVGYRTSGKELLDINFAVASLRRADPKDIYDRFMRAFFEDKVTAMKWLFFARDVRGGLGERRLFRSVFERMAVSNPEYIIPLINLVPEYGRYDDLWSLLDTELADNVMALVKKQLVEDVKAASKGENISLLAKWLPSPNASSPTTKRHAKKIFKYIGVTEREYRKTLSRLRKKLDVVERKMSARTWDTIRYEAVPSRANLIYNNAFLRNDEDRRRAFLAALEKGETKINASTLYPHDIVGKYMVDNGWGRDRLKPLDQTLEALWKSLPDTVQGCGNTIVVADGSGSMTTTVGGTSTTALEVANALAIYFAERSSGQFKDQYITFSEHPQLVNLSGGKNLREKIQIALRHNEVANTNIEAVFDLILSTAVKNNMTQEDLPKNILIISDMEFDSCATCGAARRGYGYGGYGGNRPNAKLFQTIAKRYAEAGYQIPRMVFWNVNSRTGTIPVIENDLGVALVSGFSTNIVKMVMSGKTDPYECLLETLNSERYAPIGKALSYLLVQEAKTVYEAYDKKLRELKKQSRMTVEELKLRGNMKDLLGDLDELRRDSATDKLLGAVHEGAEDLRKEVDGAIVVHASRSSTKMSVAEKNAAKAQSDAYLESLAAKYGTKPALGAASSGIAYQIPRTKITEERK